jgi:hypothetical protein
MWGLSALDTFGDIPVERIDLAAYSSVGDPPWERLLRAIHALMAHEFQH